MRKLTFAFDLDETLILFGSDKYTNGEAPLGPIHSISMDRINALPPAIFPPEYKAGNYAPHMHFLFPETLKPIFGWIAKHHSIAFVTAGAYPRELASFMLKHVYKVNDLDKIDFTYINREIKNDPTFVNKIQEYVDHPDIEASEREKRIEVAINNKALQIHFAFRSLKIKFKEEEIVLVDNEPFNILCAQEYGLKTIQACEPPPGWEEFTSKEIFSEFLQAENKENTSIYRVCRYLINIAKQCGLHDAAVNFSEENNNYDLDQIKMIKDYRGSFIYKLDVEIHKPVRAPLSPSKITSTLFNSKKADSSKKRKADQENQENIPTAKMQKSE